MILLLLLIIMEITSLGHKLYRLLSCVKTFLISSEGNPQNVPLPTPKLHNDAIFQPAIPKTWQECFYTYTKVGNRIKILLE